MWKEKISREIYDKRTDIEIVRVILRDTPYIEYDYVNYAHTSAAHKEHNKQKEDEAQRAAQETNPSIQEYHGTHFAPTPEPQQYTELEDEVAKITKGIENMATTTQTFTT